MSAAAATPVRLALVGGGSGGDAYPLLAVAGAVEARAPGSEFLFFSSPGGVENRLYAEAGHHAVPVAARRLYKKNWPLLPFTLLRGAWTARAALKAARTQAVVALGGFVSPPVVLAARSLGLPVVLIELNAVAGRANRMLARLATLVSLGYPGAAASFPDPSRCEVLGNPLRYDPDPALRAERRARHPEDLVVGVVGGSLGARVLNDLATQLYPAVADRPRLRLIHVSGRRDGDRVRADYQAAGSPANVELREYQEGMDQLYDEVDLLISRAGANSCGEVAQFGVPTIFVPLAIAPGDHQYLNALPLVEAGAAQVLREHEVDPEGILQRLDAWLEDPAPLAQLRERAGELHRRDGADALAARVLQMLGAAVGGAPAPGRDAEVVAPSGTAPAAGRSPDAEPASRVAGVTA